MSCHGNQEKNKITRSCTGMLVAICVPFMCERTIFLKSREAADFILSHNRCLRVSRVSVVDGIPLLSLSISLSGGKGGFGKLLRSQKNLGKNTTNFDSCRDLEGRRVKVAKRDEKLDNLSDSKASSSAPRTELQTEPPKSAIMLDEKYIKTLVRQAEEKKATIQVGLKAAVESVNPSERPAKRIKKTVFDDDAEDSPSD
jgi:hypothetical protein